MRPFLPSISSDEYKEILNITSKYIESVIGGVLFFDLDGNIERRLGYKINNFQLRPMYFIDKPGIWKVYLGESQQHFVESYCKYLEKDFFMTSPPAIARIKQKYLKR